MGVRFARQPPTCTLQHDLAPTPAQGSQRLQGRRRLRLYGAHRSAGIPMTLNPGHVSGAVLAIRVQRPTFASSLDASQEGAHVVFLIGWHITPAMSPALKVEQ